MSSPLRLCVGVREEQLCNFCNRISRCLDVAPCCLKIKGFRIIPEQTVMGRYVMNDSYAFLLETQKTCIFRAFNGRHPNLLLDAQEQAIVRFSLIWNSTEECKENRCSDLHRVLFQNKNCQRIKGRFFHVFFLHANLVLLTGTNNHSHIYSQFRTLPKDSSGECISCI